VRIAFPKLDPSEASPERQAELYEKVIRPCAMMDQGTRRAEWPATFELASLLSRRQNGTLVQRTKLISSEGVPMFALNILSLCDTNPDIPWARGAFFIHQIKGIKGSTSFHVDEPYISSEIEEINRQTSLNQLMINFLPNPFDFNNEFDQAYVDVGLEASYPGFVLHWDKSSHDNVTDFVIDDSEAAKDLTRQGRKGYWCDHASLLASTAGFRLSVPHHKSGPMGATYIQAYCTDKHIGSVPGIGEVAHHINGSDALAQNPRFKKTVKTMYHQAVSAAAEKTDGNARLEARVRLDCALEALPVFDEGILTTCILTYHATSWW
jgi:hypothetical protein